uniref:Phospholipid/glycerol acyltransferase domain-containing protein n=1 Tax=uncultured bacterium fosmid pJB77G10 TaxID=1478069 RepID=A0A0H3U9V3_9BACT|nr:hypothetical protein [uncultured bacterium fosmid pJB77G10]
MYNKIVMNIKDISGQELLKKLENNEISVLKCLGADGLRKEMAPAGLLCKSFADLICATSDDSSLRKRAINVMRPLAPTKQTRQFPRCEDAVVVGFNHPSLGEIFRLVAICMDVYSDKEFLFPVNLPWYENMVTIIPKLKRMGITIVPLITPSTEAKLSKINENNEAKLSEIHHAKVVFERNYMRVARSMAEKKGVILVAPSATRQATVFSENNHPTMTLLAHIILKNKDTKVMFLPVAILEPRRNDRRFNPFKFYGIRPCKPFFTEEVREISSHGREFDYEFLKRIDEVYSRVKYYRNNLK